MKRLSDYILEYRDTIGELPFDFELFNNFMQDAIIDRTHFIRLNDVRND